MHVSIGASVWFAMAVVWLCLGFFLYRKKEQKLTGISYIALILVLLNCYHSLFAALFDLTHIPVNIITIGIVDFLAGGYFWYQIIKNRQIQKYEFAWEDAALAAGVLVVVGCFAKIRFSGMQLNLNFLTIDPANHFREAMDTVNNGTITSMFYEFVWNGLFIEMLAPFAKVDYYYRWFVLSALIHFGLSGIVFYGVARRYAKTHVLKICAAALALIYLVGYPMNVTLYGFIYLGMGITVIAALIMMTDMFVQDEMPRILMIVCLMLGCLGIFSCYVLFMPITFFAVIASVFLKQWKRRKLVSVETVLTCLAIFLLPCVLGFVFVYGGIFTDGVTVSGAITNEGAEYRNLYSDFIFFVPVMIVGYLGKIKHKVNDMLLFFAPFTLLYTLYMMYKTIKGTASTYYYYKMNYLIWLIVLLLVFEGFLYANEIQTKVVCGCCVALWLATAGLCVGKIEERLQIKSPLLVEQIRSDDLNQVISFNYSALPIHMITCTDAKMELYHYVADELLAKGAGLVPVAGYWEDDLWYQAITNQRYYGWGQSDPDHTDYFTHLNEAAPEYLAVLRDSAIYADEQEYFDSLEIVYDNEIGFVVRWAPYGKTDG